MRIFSTQAGSRRQSGVVWRPHRGKKTRFRIEIKPHAMGRNFAGRQIPTFLDVTCRVRLHTVLHVVACCWELLSLKPKFETSQTF